MADYPEKKDRATQDQALFALQRELNRMAEEVPPMPEEFRRSWREAIRKEPQIPSPGEAPADLRQPKAETVSSHASPLSSPSRGLRWKRFVSTAAVLLFLLGGTLLGVDAFSPGVDVFSLTRRESTSAPLSAAPTLGGAAHEAEEAAEAEGMEEAAVMTEAEEAEEADEAAEAAMMKKANNADFDEYTDFYEYAVSDGYADSDGYANSNGYAAFGATQISAAEDNAPAALETAASPSPLRIIGIVLICLSFLAACAALLIRGKRK